ILIEAGRLAVDEFAFIAATGGGGGGGGTWGQSISSRGVAGEDGAIDHGAYGGPGGSQYAGDGGHRSSRPPSTAPPPAPRPPPRPRPASPRRCRAMAPAAAAAARAASASTPPARSIPAATSSCRSPHPAR